MQYIVVILTDKGLKIVTSLSITKLKSNKKNYSYIF